MLYLYRMCCWISLQYGKVYNKALCWTTAEHLFRLNLNLMTYDIALLATPPPTVKTALSHWGMDATITLKCAVVLGTKIVPADHSSPASYEVVPPWTGIVCPEHPSDCDLGNLKTNTSTPKTLAPQTIPDPFLLCSVLQLSGNTVSLKQSQQNIVKAFHFLHQLAFFWSWCQVFST